MKDQFPYSTVKATFGKGDIHSIKDSIIHLMDIGFALNDIFSNIVYEDVWDKGDDLIFKKELILLADYLIDNNIANEEYYSNFFDDYIGYPTSLEQRKKHWCNTGHDLIVSVDGKYYPCIRFLEMSFSEKGKARAVGNVDDGIDFDKIRPFRVLSIENCSPTKCLDCQIASGCGLCTGHDVANSEAGTIFFSRSTYICEMHKARVEAKNYFWEKLSKKGNKLKKRNVIVSQYLLPQKVLNILLSADSPPICNYNSAFHQKEVLPKKVLLKYLEIAKQKNLFINIINPIGGIRNDIKELLSNYEFQTTSLYNSEDKNYKIEKGRFFIFHINQKLEKNFSCPNSIVHLNRDQIEELAKFVINLFNHNVLRINLIINDLNKWNNNDFQLYKKSLLEIMVFLIESFKEKKPKYLNAISDRLMLKKMNNCNAGHDHFTL